MITARSNKVLIQKKPFKVIVCAVTLMAFLFNIVSYDLAWATGTPSELPGSGSDRAGSPGVFKELDPVTFILPEYLGTIKDKWSSSEQITNTEKRPTIIHIQDAHCNYAAQKRIAEIVDYLNKEYGIDTVNLEGGAKDWEPSIFTGIRDKSIREKISDHFVKEGFLTGAEYFAINNPGKIDIWGIEDTKLYINNLKAYRNSLKYKDRADKYISSLVRAINTLKLNIYSKELMDLDKRCSQYKANKTDFKDYLFCLMKYAAKKGIDINRLANIDRLRQALGSENDIDFKKANAERDDLIDRLQKCMSKDLLKELVLKTIEFKEERISQRDFYGYLFQKVELANIDLKAFPDLGKYMAYIAAYEAIDKSKLSDEIETLENAIRESLYRTDKERSLVRLSKNANILKDIFNISLTKEDYKYYKKNLGSFSVSNFTSFIEKEALSYIIVVDVDKDISELNRYREDMEKFYEYSLKRDEAFLANIRFGNCSPVSGFAGPRVSNPLTRLPSHPITILITWGFHTDNLTQLFKERGISYVSIMPNFRNCDDYQCPYFKILSGENSVRLVDAVPAMLAKSLLATPGQLFPAMRAVFEAERDLLSAPAPEVKTAISQPAVTQPLLGTRYYADKLLPRIWLWIPKVTARIWDGMKLAWRIAVTSPLRRLALVSLAITLLTPVILMADDMSGAARTALWTGGAAVVLAAAAIVAVIVWKRHRGKAVEETPLTQYSVNELYFANATSKWQPALMLDSGKIRLRFKLPGQDRRETTLSLFKALREIIASDAPKFNRDRMAFTNYRLGGLNQWVSRKFYDPPKYGYKLHIIAGDEKDAEQIISFVAPLLNGQQISYKVILDYNLYDSMSYERGIRSERSGQSGKLITIYPEDAQAAAAIADMLDAGFLKASDRIDTVQIKSEQNTFEIGGFQRYLPDDKRFGRSGRVWWRYGAIATNEEESVQEIVLPDGRRVIDDRATPDYNGKVPHLEEFSSIYKDNPADLSRRVLPASGFSGQPPATAAALPPDARVILPVAEPRSAPAADTGQAQSTSAAARSAIEALSGRLSRGEMAITATPQEAVRFQEEWAAKDKPPLPSVTYTAQEAAEFKVPGWVLEKMSDWAEANPEFERGGYFVADHSGDFVYEILDFIPMGSYILTAFSQETEGDQSVSTQFELWGRKGDCAEHFGIDLKAQAGLGFESVKPRYKGKNLIRIPWHSHPAGYDVQISPDDKSTSERNKEVSSVYCQKRGGKGVLFFYYGRNACARADLSFLTRAKKYADGTSGQPPSRGFSGFDNKDYSPPIQKAIDSGQFSAVRFNGKEFVGTKLEHDNGHIIPSIQMEGRDIEKLNAAVEYMQPEDRDILVQEGQTILFIQGLDDVLRGLHEANAPPQGCYGSHYGVQRPQYYLDPDRLDNPQQLARHLHHETQEREYLVSTLNERGRTIGPAAERDPALNAEIIQLAEEGHARLMIDSFVEDFFATVDGMKKFAKLPNDFIFMKKVVDTRLFAEYFPGVCMPDDFQDPANKTKRFKEFCEKFCGRYCVDKETATRSLIRLKTIHDKYYQLVEEINSRFERMGITGVRFSKIAFLAEGPTGNPMRNIVGEPPDAMKLGLNIDYLLNESNDIFTIAAIAHEAGHGFNTSHIDNLRSSGLEEDAEMAANWAASQILSNKEVENFINNQVRVHSERNRGRIAPHTAAHLLAYAKARGITGDSVETLSRYAPGGLVEAYTRYFASLQWHKSIASPDIGRHPAPSETITGINNYFSGILIPAFIASINELFAMLGLPQIDPAGIGPDFGRARPVLESVRDNGIRPEAYLIEEGLPYVPAWDKRPGEPAMESVSTTAVFQSPFDRGATDITQELLTQDLLYDERHGLLCALAGRSTFQDDESITDNELALELSLLAQCGMIAIIDAKGVSEEDMGNLASYSRTAVNKIDKAHEALLNRPIPYNAIKAVIIPIEYQEIADNVFGPDKVIGVPTVKRNMLVEVDGEYRTVSADIPNYEEVIKEYIGKNRGENLLFHAIRIPSPGITHSDGDEGMVGIKPVPEDGLMAKEMIRILEMPAQSVLVRELLRDVLQNASIELVREIEMRLGTLIQHVPLQKLRETIREIEQEKEKIAQRTGGKSLADKLYEKILLEKQELLVKGVDPEFAEEKFREVLANQGLSHIRYTYGQPPAQSQLARLFRHPLWKLANLPQSIFHELGHMISGGTTGKGFWKSVWEGEVEGVEGSAKRWGGIMCNLIGVAIIGNIAAHLATTYLFSGDLHSAGLAWTLGTALGLFAYFALMNIVSIITELVAWPFGRGDLAVDMAQNILTVAPQIKRDDLIKFLNHDSSFESAYKMGWTPVKLYKYVKTIAENGGFPEEKDVQLISDPTNACLMDQDPFGDRVFRMNLGYGRFTADKAIEIVPFTITHERGHTILQRMQYGTIGSGDEQYIEHRRRFEEFGGHYSKKCWDISDKVGMSKEAFISSHILIEIFTDAVVANMLNPADLRAYSEFARDGFRNIELFPDKDKYDAMLRWELTCRMYARLPGMAQSDMTDLIRIAGEYHRRAVDIIRGNEDLHRQIYAALEEYYNLTFGSWMAGNGIPVAPEAIPAQPATVTPELSTVVSQPRTKSEAKLLLGNSMFTRYVEVPVSYGDMEQLIYDETFRRQLTDLLVSHMCLTFRCRTEFAFDILEHLPLAATIELQRKGQEYHNPGNRSIIGPLYGGTENAGTGEATRGICVHSHPAVYETPSGDKLLTPLGALWPAPDDVCMSPVGIVIYGTNTTGCFMNVYRLDVRYTIALDFESGLINRRTPLILTDNDTGEVIYEARDATGFKKRFSEISLDHARRGSYKFYQLVKDYNGVFKPVPVAYEQLVSINQKMQDDKDLVSRFQKEVTCANSENKSEPSSPVSDSSRGFSGLDNEVYSPPIQEAIENGQFMAANLEGDTAIQGTLAYDDGRKIPGNTLTTTQLDNLNKAIALLEPADRDLLKGSTILFIDHLDDKVTDEARKHPSDRAPPTGHCYGTHYGIYRHQYYLDIRLLGTPEGFDPAELVRHLHHEIREREYVVSALAERGRAIPPIEERDAALNMEIAQLAGEMHDGLIAEEQSRAELFNATSSDSTTTRTTATAKALQSEVVNRRSRDPIAVVGVPWWVRDEILALGHDPDTYLKELETSKGRRIAKSGYGKLDNPRKLKLFFMEKDASDTENNLRAALERVNNDVSGLGPQEVVIFAPQIGGANVKIDSIVLGKFNGKYTVIPDTYSDIYMAKERGLPDVDARFTITRLVAWYKEAEIRNNQAAENAALNALITYINSIAITDKPIPPVADLSELLRRINLLRIKPVDYKDITDWRNSYEAVATAL